MVTPPALEPLTVAEVQTHLREDARQLEPVPDAPTVALAGAGAGNVDNGLHRYRVTFVTADGETDGGAISASVTVANKTVDGKVALSAIPLGGGAVTARKLYRTAAAGSDYFLVTTIADNTTTAYTDSTTDALLGAGVPLTNSTGNPLIASLITAARQHVEDFLNRSLITTGWRYVFDGFPPSDVVEIPRPNLLSVTAVNYTDPAGAAQLLSASVYSVDTASLPGRIVLGYTQFWPFVRAIRNAVSIDFTAGYGPARSDVPAAIKAGMKMLIAHWYQNREAVLLDGQAMDMPLGAAALLYPYRNMDASS